jgi:hypothetical protein
VGQLAARAETLFNEAEAALRTGDLATYEAKIDEARALVGRIADSLSGSGSGTQAGSA